MTKKPHFDAMPVDELWQLYEELGQILAVRLISEKRALERRLAQLRREKEASLSNSSAQRMPRERRKYPRVFPKYRNPKEPSETWSGRGKQPRWLAAALKAGHTIDEFVIGNSDGAGKNLRRRRRA